MTEDTHQEYRVLARKYRPSTFGELVGQSALVRTLTNAIEGGRLAHAFILTGVRGVGKTTTARIIARALNCTGPDGSGGPTTSPCGQCDNCKSIAESRQVDVLEMDAASRTGVDDVREIIDSVRYAPVSVRYKIYIIDEVHMLTRNAFNALLKTLEEPPEHVIFIFATTEIRKVPVTVLSRCQRFDLRRVEGPELSAHLASIAEKEGAQIEPGALALIVRASEGSVRDGLSLLDQAIAHGDGTATEADIRGMLGLADRSLIIDLFDALMQGDIQTALGQLRDQYNQGADPLVVLQDLLELSHNVTRLKAVPEGGADLALSDGELERLRAMARKLTMPVLGRVWQMLLKGINEARTAPSPVAAAEMILVRIAYAADLPSPVDLVRELKENPGAGTPPPSPVSAAPPAPASASGQASGQAAASITPPVAGIEDNALPTAEIDTVIDNAVTEALSDAEEAAEDGPADFAAVVAMFAERKEGLSYAFLMNNVRLVSFAPGEIEFSTDGRPPADLAPTVARRLTEWTGRPWVVRLASDGGGSTLAEQAAAKDLRARDQAGQDPLIQRALETFPGSKIIDVRDMIGDVLDAPDARTEDGTEDEDDMTLQTIREAGE
ncbi:MAG: DNA polymerase III subunit gamma/tau [Rhodospirillales bacterium]|nr:DNA polymerase III subunit gamma/tau [Rhodospirillales bacterium]